MNIGVFACDPGGQSGLGWGIFDPQAGDIASALRGRLHPGSATIGGTAQEQIRAIATLWRSFYRACLAENAKPHIVFEDFVFAPGVNYEGESARISTQIIWGVEGYRMGQHDTLRGAGSMPDLYLQSAGAAKGYATNARIREWGVWVVGREHERSAWQHIAYFLAQYMKHNP